MKLIKKLVILTGRGVGKGTFCAEKNAVAVSCRVNLHNLRTLSHERYLLLIICENDVYSIELGNAGSSSKSFMLPYDAEISRLHCAVLVGETVALYGTTENSRMWDGNIIDILRRKQLESKETDTNQPAQTDTQAQSPATSSTGVDTQTQIPATSSTGADTQTQIPATRSTEADKKLGTGEIDPALNSSEFATNNETSPSTTNMSQTNLDNKRDIKDYFLDIISDYNDEAVAEVNYFGGIQKKEPPALKPELTKKYYNKLFEADLECKKEDPVATSTDKNYHTNNEDIQHKDSARMPTDKNYHTSNEDIQHKDSDRTPTNKNYHTSNEDIQYKNPIETPTDQDCYTSKVNSQNPNAIVSRNSLKSNRRDKPQFRSYYENLKEKYGYNKNVLDEYKSVTANELNNSPSKNEPPANDLKNFPPASDFENNSPASDFENYPPAGSFKNPHSAGNFKSGQSTRSFKNEAIKDKVVDDFVSPILEAASTLSLKKAPPLESTFSRIRLGTFYEQIKDQIETIFKTYARNQELESIIPDSKWARVDYNGDGKYYVIGVIGKPDYICYGVPAIYTPTPPPELADYCQWLPLEINNPTGRGYWLLFQDAVSGNSIKNEII